MLSLLNQIKDEKKLKELAKEQHYQQELYQLFNLGDIDELLRFYKTKKLYRDYPEKAAFKTPTFYDLAPSGNGLGISQQLQNFTVYHTPLANTISRAMSALLFADEPQLSGDEEKIELLNKIYDENELGSLLTKAGEQESVSGAVAFKPIIDLEFSDYPIIQLYQKGEFIVYKKYDKLVSVIFIDKYNIENQQYTLYSEHGKGFINHKLFKNNEEVALNSIPETAHLKNITFFEGEKESKQLMAIYKENNPTASSDYLAVLDDFQAADEAYSNMMNWIRKSGPKRIVSESALSRDDYGNLIAPVEYSFDYIIKYSNSTNAQEEVNELQTPADVNNPIQACKASLDEIRRNIATTVGLSVKTFTAFDAAGANASAEALITRKDIDYQTRENKLKGWYEAFDRLNILLLSLYKAKQVGDRIYLNEIDLTDVTVEFYSPAKPTFEQLVEEVRNLLDAGLIDEEGALQRLWVDTKLKSEEEVHEMYLKIIGEEKPEILNEDIDQDGENIEEDDEDVDEEELIAKLKEWGLDDDEIKAFLEDIRGLSEDERIAKEKQLQDKKYKKSA